MTANPSRGHRLIVPEVVQTSAMDCGPAALKCLLEGFGISVGYGRLREACQTDVDGTSIDTIEEIAVQLGLEAEQVMLPVDHLLLPEARALPAIVVSVRPTASPISSSSGSVMAALSRSWIRPLGGAGSARGSCSMLSTST